MTGPTTPTTRPTAASLWVIAGMILAAAAARVIPHPPNFTPIGAMALFAGATLRDRRLAVLLPLAAMFVSDLLLGSHSTFLFVYGSYALIALLGQTLQRHRRSALRIGGASLAASLLFFTITNFGSWISYDWYPHTLGGLVACYVAAIPFLGDTQATTFFLNTAVGDLFFSAALFGGLVFVEKLATRGQQVSLLGDDA